MRTLPLKRARAGTAIRCRCTLLSLASIFLLPLAAHAQSDFTPASSQPPIATRAESSDGTPVETPRGFDNKPDFTGYWRPIREPGKPGGNLGKDQPNFQLPFNETGLRAQVYSQNHTVDPEAICIHGGIPRHNGSGLPFEVLHTPKRLATIYNFNTHRLATIGTDLRHPENPEPRYFGHAIGHWEGDVLVLETRGLRDSSKDHIWLDENGNPTSDQAIIIERWSRPDYHHLRLQMTVTDPKYYARPFTFDRTWRRAEQGAGGYEFACNESNIVRDHMGPGAGVIGPDGNRGFGYNAPLPDEPPGPEAYEDVLQR